MSHKKFGVLFILLTLGLRAKAVELHRFTAESVNNTVVLSWEVANEATAGAYVLERSLDGVVWRIFARVPAFNRGLGSELYQTVHGLQSAYRYYRIRFAPTGLPEPEGLILAVAYAELGAAHLFVRTTPNPGQQRLGLHYTLDADKPLLVRVYDHVGQEIWTQALPSGEAGVYDIDLDFKAFGRGIYLLVFTQIDKNLNLAETRVEF